MANITAKLNQRTSAKLANALEALCECMRYVESTDGTRGDLVGCAVNKNEYEWWKKLAKDIS